MILDPMFVCEQRLERARAKFSADAKDGRSFGRHRHRQTGMVAAVQLPLFITRTGGLRADA